MSDLGAHHHFQKSNSFEFCTAFDYAARVCGPTDLRCFHLTFSLQFCIPAQKNQYIKGEIKFNNIYMLSPRLDGCFYRNELMNKYILEIGPLDPEDQILDYGSLGNFSLSGFEMVLTRYVSTYIITYYLPSGKPSHVPQRYAIICEQF